MRSLKGKLLLDGGKLAGSPFHRSVVLICEHDAEGAFGLVLNRRTEHVVGEAIGVPVTDFVKDLPVFWGGPLQPRALSVLLGEPSKSDANVMPGLRLAHTLDDLVEPKFPVPAQVKFFAGYAGWSPGQLDDEMKEKEWLTHPASLDLVFHPQTEELWKAILCNLGPEYRLLAEAPDNVSWN